MTDFSSYKTTLESLKVTLTEDLNTIAAHNEATDDWEVRTDQTGSNEPDANIQADSEEDAEERIATLAELETRYRNIVRALKKIEAGTYGICEISGAPIEAKRLEANPAARTCMAHMNEEADLPL